MVALKSSQTVTRVTDRRNWLFDDLLMNASTELVLALGVLAALGTAALRFGVSNAMEGLGLTFLLVCLKIARAAIRGLAALLKMLSR